MIGEVEWEHSDHKKGVTVWWAPIKRVSRGTIYLSMRTRYLSVGESFDSTSQDKDVVDINWNFYKNAWDQSLILYSRF